MKRALITIAALPLLAACAASHPAAVHHHATPAASPVTDSRAAAACSKLTAAAFPPAAYDQLVISEANRVAHGGNLTPAQTRKVKATIAAEVKASCPQFAYLSKQEH